MLLIDDDSDARRLVRRLLAGDGFHVEEASDGASGIALARSLHPDAIMLDVLMPGMDGWSVLKALRGEPSLAEMIPFERQFQTFHSVQNYFLLNELLAPGFPMPVIDTETLRRARAGFVERFSSRPYYFVRAATPQMLLDEVDRVL